MMKNNLNFNEYKKLMDINIKRNCQFLKEFSKWLKKKKLDKKTISNHIKNVDLFLNDYLNYHNIKKMEEGQKEIDSFLSNWLSNIYGNSNKVFLRNMKESLDLFYECMQEKSE